MNLLDWLKPREVRWTLEALDEAIWSGPNELYDPRSLIAQSSKKRIRNAEKTCYSIRVGGHTPETLALFIATDVVETFLFSGRLHTYRGILSGAGHAMKKQLLHLYALQKKAGSLSIEEYQQAISGMEAEIRTIG